jgi:hypothetical protein
MVIKLTTKITKGIILLLMAILVVSAIGLFDFGCAASKYFNDITIESPVTGAILNTDSVTVKIQVTYSSWLDMTSLQANCYLDGKLYTQVQLLETSENSPGGSPCVANGEFVLQNLTQGAHRLEINGTGKGYTEIINSVDVNEDLSSGVSTFNVNLSSTTPTNTSVPSSFSLLAFILSGVIVIVVLASIALLIIYRKHSLKLKVNGDSTEKEN